MRFAPKYAERAVRDLAGLDKTVSRRVIDKIDEYCATDNPMRFASPLRGKLGGLFRFRIGDYRAIFRPDSRGQIVILLILRVGHRSEIYG